MSPKKKLSKLDAALLSAVEKSNAKAVARHLAEGASPDTRDDQGYPVLHTACSENDLDIVRLLLDAGADMNGLDAESATPLGFATAHPGAKAVELVKLLIDKGSDVNHAWKDEAGSTVLTDLLDPENNDEPSAKLLELLLRAGANPNKPNARGWYPLHVAARLEDPKFVTLLLDAGADPKAASQGGYYPIDTASFRGNTRVMRRLLAGGSPTLEQATKNRAESVWKRMGAWAARHNKTYAKGLKNTRPATEARVTALEKALDSELPLDFRTFLLRFGGGTPPGKPGVSIAEYEVLPVEQILSRWKGLRDLVEKGTFKKATPHELSKSQKKVKWTWWHPGWVPFAEDGGGNLKCVDLEPGPEGTRGQVIGWEIHGGPLHPYAPSMEEFLEHYLEDLESGRIELQED